MARARKVLLADPSGDSLNGLSRALREKGYQVLVATDGSRALEIAVLRHPDLVLFDEDCRLVRARTFTQILRTNPRTEDIPVLVTGTSNDAERSRNLREGYLRKPFNLNDVLGRIAQILRRVDAARDLRNENREIQGSLRQMSVTDVLQVLSQNKRSGSLSLERGEDRGEIFLVDGQPVNSKVGLVEGEKAFFRLLTFKDGRFAFVPSTYTGPVHIRRMMDEALLEGLRQSDELESLASRLPAPSARLKLARAASQIGEVDSVTSEVLKLVSEPRSLRDLLDTASAVDCDVLAAVGSLLDKGAVQLAPPALAPSSGPILNAAEQHALRARILRGRPASKQVVGKSILLSDSQRTVRSFLERLANLPGFRVIRPPTYELLGTWARIEFPEGLCVELCSIPGAGDAQPLWRPFSAGALGALALDRGAAALRLASFFARETRMPLLVLGDGELPNALKGISGIIPSANDPKQAIRELFEIVLRSAV